MSAPGLDIRSAVGRLVGRTPDAVGELGREPIDYDAFMAGRTLTRLRGEASVDGRDVAWSLVEKRTEGPATAPAYLYDNGEREFRAYRSGLLEDLAPGLRAARLLAAARDADGALTLWIEDLGAGGHVRLTEERLPLAARDLGRMAGRWLGRVPDHPWLFGGWIERHSQPNAVADGLAVVEAARDEPDIAARTRGKLAEAAGLIASQAAYGSILERLAPTLCHHDAVAANVFATTGGGDPETVLIDWESVGPGPAGADLASLLFSSARRGDISARPLPELIPRALDAYADGMAEAGARVERDAIELGFHASIALRWTLVRDTVRILGGGGAAVRGSAPHETGAEALNEFLALIPVLLDSAAEARRLSGR